MNAAARALEVQDYETAVSRAYYAAYHAVVAIFESRLNLIRPRWSHNFLPYFERNAEVRDLRFDVAYLYEMRAKADYEDAAFTADDVQRVLAAGRRVVDRAGEETGHA
jgi:uncharacterized protein (UPF0332 family)